MLLYSLLLSVAAVVSAPVWAWRMLRQGRYRQGLAQRLGAVPATWQMAAKSREVVWFHAVSVGETMAALPLIAALQTAMPTALLVLSTTTPTGQAVARERLGADRVFFYPLDFAFAVRPWLRALQPRLLVLLESELWPRMLAECSRPGVPVAVVNARVSDRSLPRYLALRSLWKPLLAKVSLLLAQSDEDRDRWLRIGAPAERTRVVGNLKYDVPGTEETALARLLRPHLPPETPVLMAGSTHPGEEALLLACRASRHLLVLAPRHPQRAAEVAALVTGAGLTPLLLSAWRTAPQNLTAEDVLVIDTVGELAGLYPLANAAFVGGSLVAAGGHNPLEPARSGVPVLTGPHTENFREITAELQAIGALRVVTPDTLCTGIAKALHIDQNAPGASDSASSRAAAAAFFQQQSGAVQRTVEALLGLLQAGRR